MKQARRKMKGQEVRFLVVLSLVSLLLPVVLAPAIQKYKAHQEWLNAWKNDPKISVLEREARNVLGLQIYGAVNCGEIYSFGGAVDYFSNEESAKQEAQWAQQVMKKAVGAYHKRVPFIYHKRIDNWVLGLSDPSQSPVYTDEHRIVVGTPNGEVHEFWWDANTGDSPDGRRIIAHRKWHKPFIDMTQGKLDFRDANPDGEAAK